jgi:hypothetical protein
MRAPPLAYRWISVGFLGQAIGTASPVCDLGLVNLVAHVVGRRETGSGADHAVNIDQAAADSANQMMVVVADPILESGGRTGGLNPPDEAFCDQDPESVVHRLGRNGADLGPDDFGYTVSRDMGTTRDSPQDSQSLGRNLNPMLPKEVRRVTSHIGMLDQIIDSFKYLTS